jgi:hypothetical protein
VSFQGEICRSLEEEEANDQKFKVDRWLRKEVSSYGITNNRLLVFNATVIYNFSYIVAVSFFGGENKKTCRKPQTSSKSLINLS